MGRTIYVTSRYLLAESTLSSFPCFLFLFLFFWVTMASLAAPQRVLACMRGTKVAMKDEKTISTMSLRRARYGAQRLTGRCGLRGRVADGGGVANGAVRAAGCSTGQWPPPSRQVGASEAPCYISNRVLRPSPASQAADFTWWRLPEDAHLGRRFRALEPQVPVRHAREQIREADTSSQMAMRKIKHGPLRDQPSRPLRRRQIAAENAGQGGQARHEWVSDCQARSSGKEYHHPQGRIQEGSGDGRSADDGTRSGIPDAGCPPWTRPRPAPTKGCRRPMERGVQTTSEDRRGSADGACCCCGGAKGDGARSARGPIPRGPLDGDARECLG